LNPIVSKGARVFPVFPDGSRIAANAGGTIYFFQNSMASHTTHSVGHSANCLALSTDGSRMVAAGTGIQYLGNNYFLPLSSQGTISVF
jgi:hypothetical protein